MCGIAGIWAGASANRHIELNEAIRKMTRAISTRGPDDEGFLTDESAALAIGHRRLSIIDISPLGHQPMESASGRFVIVYNGEVYNFAALRARLENEGHIFRGHSDTEVMLAAIEAWGLDNAIAEFNGMFAFALWDRKLRRLQVVRDRLGIKPLYFGWNSGCFVFASELKALQAWRGFRGEINRNALTSYLRHNYIPAPYSIYEGIYKLLPGTYLTLAQEDIQDSKRDWSEIEKATTVYWSARAVAEKGYVNREECSVDEAINKLESLIDSSVRFRMESDVPLGAFLSGGIDSSTVVASMQAQSDRPIQTFTIGFETDTHDEARYARDTARHLGTDHTELYVTSAQARDVIPDLPTIFDEPFADSSQIPTYLVSKLARNSVTVSLSGDGGDELFGGYNRYFLAQQWWGRLSRIPLPLRKLGAATVRAAPNVSSSIYDLVAPRLNKSLGLSDSKEKLRKLAQVMSFSHPDQVYKQLVSHWSRPDTNVISGQEVPTIITDQNRQADIDQSVERMMFMDLVSYLPDDILTKVDRASMAVSLEARVPLLDYRIVEFAWTLPLSMKIANGKGKHVLRQVLKRRVPESFFERPKMGFSIPLEGWLRGPLRDWAEDLLSESRITADGYFHPGPIRRLWDGHLSGKLSEQYRLWDILMFQQWLHSSRNQIAG